MSVKRDLRQLELGEDDLQKQATKRRKIQKERKEKKQAENSERKKEEEQAMYISFIL